VPGKRGPARRQKSPADEGEPGALQLMEPHLEFKRFTYGWRDAHVGISLAQPKQIRSIADQYISLAAAANSKQQRDAFLDMARSWLRTTALAEAQSTKTHHPQPRPHK
jgi:hypothetical protein